MPTAKKQPSGNWKVTIYDYKDSSGKIHRKTFTAPTKKEAERKAASYSGVRSSGVLSLTLKEAIEKYINDRKAVLSPATVVTYTQQKDRYCKSITGLKLSSLTNEKIQQAINQEAVKLSPKSVRNIYGLIQKVLHEFRPDLTLSIRLPQKQKPNLDIPDDEEVRRILQAVSGTRMELPVLLSAFGPMRRGEIAALQYDCVSGSVVHVCRNMVKDENKEWVIKSPKTYAGDRYITFPAIVTKHFKPDGVGSVCDVTPDYISHTWIKLKKKYNITCRFHDLRHYCASLMHTMMPDQYIMQRGGWSTDATLKQVYRHALSDRSAELNNTLNTFIDQNMHPNMHPNK